MQKNDNGPLLEVAKAISDGAPVDWDKAASTHQDLRRKLGRLRLIEALATAHSDPAAPRLRVAPSPEQTTEVFISGPSVWGPLRIVEKLGQGGFGEVFRAFDPTLQRHVALKLRRQEDPRPGHHARRFLDEARRLARVKHPNVLVVHGADEHEGRVGLWTDLLEGKTLEGCLEEQGPFGAHEAALVGVDLCRALAAVHGAGLVHRDVKSSNVMRETGGRIVLMDFGSVGESPTAGRPDAQHEISGTPQAMAPEVLLRGEVPGPAADIYALGVLLYRLVSARYPIEAANFRQLREMLGRREMRSLRDVRPDLPAAFVRIVETALEDDPRRRFASAGEMERALIGSIGALAPRVEQAIEPIARPPARRWPAVAAAGVAIGATAIALLLWRSSPASSFTVEASLFRQASGAEERLAEGARVAAGDKMFMEVKGSTELFVYVLNEDEKGEVFVLFPAGTDLSNPLPPQILHRLPGELAGIPQSWEVTSAGGGESIYIIAAREALPDLEREIASLPHAEPGRPVTYVRLDAGSLGRVTRGVGGMVSAQPRDSGNDASGLSRVARILPREAESATGVWIRRLHLENPERP